MRNMNQMMKQVKKMQQEMAKAQQELEKKEVVGTAGGGVVKVTMNGHKQLVSIEISPDVVDADDVEMLQDLVMAAFNEAMKKVDEMVSNDLGKFTSGLNIPGLF
ncbi:YbaB/EbfC family nucleoid-associated protein [Thermoflavimicrobium daqui]|uniref:Nucleoid-associated protein DL897_12310 n=1 Tax=Thermoflavimicrobium daqui TaxID=2137476 RepID=A0A364K3P0_9BACL|nr:YbaB/EbfC family nucleoid-associated protein [Thermoflavimicrobium daqui]RAL23457.1 YbaB/EbfC family nucleoid-associated protein [Thermoflavimicrobium daqui]